MNEMNNDNDTYVLTTITDPIGNIHFIQNNNIIHQEDDANNNIIHQEEIEVPRWFIDRFPAIITINDVEYYTMNDTEEGLTSEIYTPITRLTGRSTTPPPPPPITVTCDFININKEEEKYNECCICIETLDTTEFCLLNCNHLFCGNCLKNLIKSNINKRKNTICPLCRTNITNITTQTTHLHHIISEQCI